MKYLPRPESQRWWIGNPGSLDATAQAVELMEIYGIPDDLDLNFASARFCGRWQEELSAEQWIAAATLDRLNHLPGVTQPTWLEVLYYERSLLAAAVLVGLCLYATFSSPQARFNDFTDEESGPGQQGIVD